VARVWKLKTPSFGRHNKKPAPMLGHAKIGCIKDLRLDGISLATETGDQTCEIHASLAHSKANDILD
jgi:hypothetical protein